MAKNGIRTCSDYLEPTPEELEAQEGWVKKTIAGVFISRSAIVEHIRANSKENQDWQDQVACPVCQAGQLHFTYAGAYNGHIHAWCTTPECVQWIE